MSDNSFFRIAKVVLSYMVYERFILLLIAIYKHGFHNPPFGHTTDEARSRIVAPSVHFTQGINFMQLWSSLFPQDRKLLLYRA